MFDARWTLSVTIAHVDWLFGSGELKWLKMIGHFLFPLSSKMLYINYVLCWRYIIHVLSILCWQVFCFPKKTCFIYIKNTSLIQKHSSITLTWGCLCGKGMSFWRIKGVPFMRCISTHKRIWSRLCGKRVMRRHIPHYHVSNLDSLISHFNHIVLKSLISDNNHISENNHSYYWNM